METGFLGVFKEGRDSAETDKGVFCVCVRVRVCVCVCEYVLQGMHAHVCMYTQACTHTQPHAHTSKWGRSEML